MTPQLDEKVTTCDSHDNGINQVNLNSIKVVELEREKYDWYDESDDVELSTAYPDATPAERLRFLITYDGNLEAASKALGDYLQWRKDTGIDDMNAIIKEKEKVSTEYPNMKEDEILWYIATSTAYSVLDETNLRDPTDKSLPPIVAFPDVDENGKKITSLDGYRVIRFIGQMTDFNEASPQVYALACAIFVDLIQDRHSMEKFVSVIDLRPGRGWANTPGRRQLPFIRGMLTITSRHHLERMQTMSLYPVSRIGIVVWNIVKQFLEPAHRDKINIYNGPAIIEAQSPEELIDFFEEDVIDYFETSRKSLFNEE